MNTNNRISASFIALNDTLDDAISKLTKWIS